MNVFACPGIVPDGVRHGTFGTICGMMFGEVVMLIAAVTCTTHGRIVVVLVSDVVHVTVAPVLPVNGVPLMSVTVAVQIEPVFPPAMLLGLQLTEIRGVPDGETVIRVEPIAVSPPMPEA